MVFVAYCEYIHYFETYTSNQIRLQFNVACDTRFVSNKANANANAESPYCYT